MSKRKTQSTFILLACLFGVITSVLFCSSNTYGAILGYDNFASASAQELAGDGWINQMGIHDGYTFATDGYITSVSIRNDSDTKAEPLDIMVIEILGNDNFKILSRITLTANDDSPTTTNGITTYTLSSPLAVSAGNTFAHWSSNSGPVPLNNWSSVDAGGFFHGSRWVQIESDLIETGDSIYSPRSSGIPYRDYFINVEYVPEPATIAMLGIGAIGFIRSRRKI